MDKDVQIIEYGVFAWYEGEWHDSTDEQKPYTAEDFALAFECDDAMLESGASYRSDRISNWSNVPRDKPVIYRWYFIGESEGERVRGEITSIDMPPTK